MLKNITRTLSLSLLALNSLYADNPPSNSQIKPQFTDQMLEKYGSGFTSLEHKNMGDLVQLHLLKRSRGNLKLTLPNGIKVSYGDIVMYAGDMFGNPSSPISSCAKKDRSACFKSQFDAMAVNGNINDKRCENPINQAKALKTYIIQLEKDLDASRQEGVTDWAFYDEHDVDISKEMNKITCGGSFVSGFIPYGNYIKLAQVNFDHFAPDSITAYKVGHRYAMETALQGYKQEQQGLHDEAQRLLEIAYAQNAYANHYLTDSFSAGHMRTPRRAIDKDIALPAALNLLIANLMHNEDNRNGLNVVNAEGTSWLAFGDGYLYKPEAQLQKSIMLDAMQRSADGVYNVFVTGLIPDTYSELNLVPDYKKIAQLNDSSPLFKVENGVLLKRVNNTDIYDDHWTQYWSGLITLIQFKVNP